MPRVIYVTGGGFVAAPKETSLDLRTFVAESGFVVASIQYRTVLDGATYKGSVADVKAAIRYLRANAKAYSIDPDGDMAVMGKPGTGLPWSASQTMGIIVEFLHRTLDPPRA